MSGDGYENELRALQVELVRLQAWVRATGARVLVIFEGRDTAGKGGAIRRFTRHLNPKAMRVVALPRPTEVERGQWFFQRYITHLPNPGEIVFFDRSWYNRAVVEPVMGFCTKEEYERFLRQVRLVESMLIEDGIFLVKLWFSIDIAEQKRRLRARETDPLKRWKLSTTDLEAQRRWTESTRHKERMFAETHLPGSPWIVVSGNDKQRARVESIRYVLSRIDYAGRGESEVPLEPEPEIVRPAPVPYADARTPGERP